MQQILNITETRNNLSSIVSRVAKQKKSVVIIRDSMPEAVLIPYSEFVRKEEEQSQLWKLRFTQLLKKGKVALQKWAKANKINLNSLSEEDMYELVTKI